MPMILLIRHAQGSFGGADYDILSDRGVRQAETLALDLAGRGVRADEVACGSLARQYNTAAPIAAAAGCEPQVDPRWDEYDIEDILAEHSTSAARPDRPPGSDAPPISARAFQDILDGALGAWIAAGPAGPTRETWPAFADRVNGALLELAGGLASGTTAVVASSAGVIAAICARVMGLPDEALLAFNRVSINTGVTKLVRGRSDTTLLSFNDHSHLERADAALITYR